MSTENIIIAHLDNEDQENVLKTILKALKIKFEIHKKDKPYDSEFVKKILESKQEFKKGQFKSISTTDLWK